MGTRKFEKLILSSAKSKNDIVAEALAEIRKYEAKDPANDYICSVIHAYDNGDNAGDQYIVINEKLRVEYGLKSNAVASSHYSKADIKAMIDEVDAKIPLDPAKEALLKEVEAIEADIRAKEAQLPPKEKELRNLKQQKATIEQEIADLNSLIAQARAEGRSTTVLEASKAQRTADLATKNRQISTLEGQINEIKRQIPLLKEQAKNKQTQQEAIKSPELATKAYVDGINTTLTRSINTKANANAVVTLTGNQTVAGVKTFSSPIVVPNATANTHAVNLAQLNTKANQATTYTKTEVDTRVNAKANANATVNLTDNQTIAGNKTLSGATTFNGAITSKGANTFTGNNTFNTGQVTFNNKAPISNVAPTVANHLATKAYVDGINTTLTRSINTKANANAVVTLTGNQTIAGVKTFSSPVVVPNATANTHAVNLAQLNTKANQATTYTKTEVNNLVNAKANANATVNLTGNQTVAGVKTFSAVPVCSILPTADTQLANRNYVKKRGGYVAVTGGAINLNNGINFSLNLTAATNITVANAAANIGQTGEIFIAKGANIQAFSAPFNFRIAQSGFGNNEVFSYTVVSKSLVRIVRS